MLAFTLQMFDPPSAISINHKQILSAVDVFNLHNRTSKRVSTELFITTGTRGGQCVYFIIYCIILV